MKNTTSIQNLKDAITEFGSEILTETYSTSGAMLDAYQAGEIDAISNDIPFLSAALEGFDNPAEHRLLNEPISKEPLAMVVDENQSTWADAVRWGNYALVKAEEYGITQDNIDNFVARNTDKSENNDSNSAIRQFLGVESNLGKTLGLPNDFAVQAVQAVGNYGEIFQRHFKPELLRRDRNELSSEFGLQYALPGGNIAAESDALPQIEDITLEETVWCGEQIFFRTELFAEAFSDPSGSSLAEIYISKLPENGTLLLDGKPVQAWDFITADQLNSLVVEPLEGFTGTLEFSWNGLNSEFWGAPFDKVVRIEVRQEDTTPANQPPEIEHITHQATVAENGEIALGSDAFAEVFSDTEGSSLDSIRINDLPENATLLLGGEPVSAGDVISASELDSLSLQPDEGFTGTIRFRWNASDGDRFSLFEKTIRVEVKAAEKETDHEVTDSNQGFEVTPQNDDVSATDGNDAIAALSGTDNIRGNGGDDTINGNQGDDSINGGDGNDVIYGGQQNDNLSGGNGNDIFSGDLGNDVIGGGNNNDLIFSGQGNDNANGDSGNDTIFGSQGEDVLRGNNDNDIIFGGQQADILSGGDGNDFLSGDLQEDTLTGGEGEDHFLLRNVSGADIITDFEDGVDLLVLPTSDFPLQPNGFTFENLTVTQAEGGTVISVNGNTMAGLTGVDATTITEEDFQDISTL